jgi:hypothetical protein
MASAGKTNTKNRIIVPDLIFRCAIVALLVILSALIRKDIQASFIILQLASGEKGGSPLASSTSYLDVMEPVRT